MAIITVTMKDPDYGIDSGDDDNASVRRVLDAFLEWNEYITVEFDTKKMTARVVPVKEQR